MKKRAIESTLKSDCFVSTWDMRHSKGTGEMVRKAVFISSAGIYREKMVIWYPIEWHQTGKKPA